MSEKIFDGSFLRKLERLKLFVRRASPTIAEGSKLSKRRGSGIDFMDYRGYAQGDEIRYIDWNVYARSEGLFIREFAKEDAVPIYIILDNSPSMDFGVPSKFTFAKKLSAALSYIGLICLDKVILCFEYDNRFVLQDFRGEHSISQVFDTLTAMEVSSSMRLSEVIVRTHSIAKKGGSFFVISDFWDDGVQQEKLKKLASATSDVSLIHILSPDEIKPSNKGRVRLVDSEMDSCVDRFIGEDEVITYEQLLREHINSYRKFAMRYNINYLFASTDSAFDEVIMIYLRDVAVLR